MKKIALLVFSVFTLQSVAQDTISVNLINTNTAQALSTANLPTFRVFSKNNTDEKWIILENIRHQDRLEWLWTIEIQDAAGIVHTKKADWSIIEDSVDDFRVKMIEAAPSHYLNAEVYLSPYLEDFMFEAWQYYHFLPGQYRIRLSYQLPQSRIYQVADLLSIKHKTLTTKVIQTNWLELVINESKVYFPTDFDKVTFEKVNNPHLNWMKQLTVVQDDKHIKEQLFDWNNHLVAEFVPTEPTDSATHINLYSGKQFEIKNNNTINGRFQKYSANIYGIKYSASKEVLISEGNIEQGRVNDAVYIYNSIPTYSKRLITYKEGLPNGKFKFWQATQDSEKLILREKGFYKDSLRHKRYIEYYENGKLFQKLRYKKGLVKGKVKTFNNTGQLIFVQHFKPIIKEESSLKDNRLLAGKLYHDKQVRHGTFVSFDTLGQVTQKQRYRNDVLVGRHFQKITLEHQTYTTIGFYKNGRPWRGQFIHYQSQTTRGRYGVERSYTVYRTTYAKGVILLSETLTEGEGWLILH